MADRHSRTAAGGQPDRTMRALWVMFVVAIGVVLIGAMYVLGTLSGVAIEKNENPTQTSHSAKSGSTFVDK
jgi:hypothetical protein